jgi:hypothetical protein
VRNSLLFPTGVNASSVRIVFGGGVAAAASSSGGGGLQQHAYAAKFTGGMGYHFNGSNTSKMPVGDEPESIYMVRPCAEWAGCT